MTEDTNRDVLKENISKVIESYPTLTVKDLVLEAKDYQEAAYNYLQVISKIIKEGNISGRKAKVKDLDVRKFNLATYMWDDLIKTHKMSMMKIYKTYTELINAVKRKKQTCYTKILIGGLDKGTENYYYFDLQGNAYNFAVDVKSY